MVIGAGLVLFEVQQNSDTTFRIYDWGRPRELHLKEAREAVRSACTGTAEINPQIDEGILVACDEFIMKKIPIHKTGALVPEEKTYSALILLEGEGEIKAEGYGSEFKKGDAYFLPARCRELTLQSPGEVLAMLCLQGKE